MADVRFEGVHKSFGKVQAVDDVNLEVADGEFVVLLGPSGCGKTTLLRCLAGLEKVDAGRVTIGGRDATDFPPRRRRIAMVFQSYAVFPHMRVYDNVAFGLKMQRQSKSLIKERVDSAARLLHIEQFLDRYPSQLSGGQRQRVAVARAIATKADVLLMDEPLSNLDALLRMEMRAELKTLLRKLEATTIYVTHDQVEALSMGDRIAVMNAGRLVQVDNPLVVYDRPADTFVGGFIGTPPMNFLATEIVGGRDRSGRAAKRGRRWARRRLREALGAQTDARHPRGVGARSDRGRRWRDPRDGRRRRASRVAQPADGSHRRRHAEGVGAARRPPDAGQRHLATHRAGANPLDASGERPGLRSGARRAVSGAGRGAVAGALTEHVVVLRGPRDVAVVEQEGRPPGDGEVRVATHYSGISAGTELTTYRGSNPYLAKQWDASTRQFAEGAPRWSYPLQDWGYEQVGEVVAVGRGVERVRPGDLVWGVWGHRSAAVVVESAVAGRVLAHGVEPRLGVFARIGAVALNAVLDADVHVGEVVAVFGQGVAGLIATQLATLNGSTVVAVDAIPRRLELASSLGAVHALAADARPAEAIKELTEGRGADVSIELSGHYAALHEAIRATAYASRVVVAGFLQGGGDALRLGEEFHHNRIELVSSQISNVAPRLAHRWSVSRLERTVVGLAAEGRLQLEPLVSHVLPAERAADAFRLLDERPEEAVQVVLDFT